jgi:hypothetical protein
MKDHKNPEDHKNPIVWVSMWEEVVVADTKKVCVSIEAVASVVDMASMGESSMSRVMTP